MAIPVILKGDTSAKISLNVADGWDYTGVALDVEFCGVVKTIVEPVAGSVIDVVYAADDTARFPLGTHKVIMTLRGEGGERSTLPWGKIKVTDAPAEVYDCAITIDPGIAFVDELPERFTENDMRTKINQILSCMKRCVAFFAFLTIASEANAASVLTAPKGEIYNDAPVVTNVSFEGLLPKVCGPLKLDWSQRYSEDVLSLKAPAFPMYWLTMTPEQIVINGPEEHSTSILAAYIRINHAYYYADCISLPYGDLKYPAKGGTFAVLSDIEAATNNIPQVVTNVVRDVQGLVYDEKLGITWKQTMYDGNLYYIAVTNANITEVQ